MPPAASTSASATAWLTGAGVLVAGFIDWFQGSSPQGVFALPKWIGLVVFVIAVLGTAACAFAATRRDALNGAIGLRVAAVALAAVAAMVGDPTYAVLLLAIPLVDTARRGQDSTRRAEIAAIFVLAVVLVVIEPQSWNGNGLEATLVLFIALLVAAMLGNALGQLDHARRLESQLARLDERDHLASELHDSVGHNLLATSIQLKTASALWEGSPDAALRSVDLASHAVAEALLDTRIAVDTMRSEGPAFSLAQALPGLVDRVSSPSLHTDLTLKGETDAIDQLAQITLYRVAQEALTNTVRHAQATTVAVVLTVTGSESTLVISDDGSGFDVDAVEMSAGLRSLSERLNRIGGSLDVASSPGAGTTLTAVVGRDR